MRITVHRLNAVQAVDTGDDFMCVEIDLGDGQVFRITPEEPEERDSYLSVSSTGRAYQLIVEPQAGNTARIRARR